MTDTYTPSERAFLERLEQCHQWPCAYTFKFIIPSASYALLKERLEALPELASLGGEDGLAMGVRASGGGKYVSVTLEPELENAGQVLAVHRALEGIPGIMAL